jgi:hypothetical protein
VYCHLRKTEIFIVIEKKSTTNVCEYVWMGRALAARGEAKKEEKKRVKQAGRLLAGWCVRYFEKKTPRELGEVGEHTWKNAKASCPWH